jgi:hypothetical protein
MVFINYPSVSAPDLPFGGIKRSGYGKELSNLGIEEFINKKLVCVADEAFHVNFDLVAKPTRSFAGNHGPSLYPTQRRAPVACCR